MEIVGQSVAGIAHDFNNMMTCVIGALDLLQILLKREQSDDIDTLLGDATVAANRAQALASRLLAFSHPTSNDPHPIDVNSVVRSMETLLRSALGIGIQCDLRLSDGLVPIFCDTHEFENAIFNLVINARDAISAGGIVRIETCATILDDRDGALESREYVSISVTDNGAGMSPELIQRAFEPFFTTKASDKGTGLGLPLVRSFVERFDGHLDVESAVNQGTSIRMYFPPIHGAPDLLIRDMRERSPPPR